MEEKVIKVLLVVIVFLLIVIGISGYTYYKINIIGNIEFEEINKSKENLGIQESPKQVKVEKKEDLEEVKEVEVKEVNEKEVKESIEKPVYRIVLVGVDSRTQSNKGSADAIIVVTIDTEQKKIKLASFLRDLQVDINGKKDKINHTYAYDGGVGLLRALNSNFDLDITEYATVNMFNLREVIDKIGKIEVDIKKNEIREINFRIREAAELEGWGDYEVLETTGKQEINGEQAVAYMRIRNTGSGDVDRTGRQRQVLSLLFQEISNKNILQLMGIAKESAKLVSTTLEQSKIEEIVIKILPMLSEMEIESKVYPNNDMAYSDMSTGIFYWKLRDKDKFTTEVKEFIGY